MPSSSMPPAPSPVDVAVVGGGIVGLATARALLRRFDASVAVLEAEGTLAAHAGGAAGLTSMLAGPELPPRLVSSSPPRHPANGRAGHERAAPAQAGAAAPIRHGREDRSRSRQRRTRP